MKSASTVSLSAITDGWDCVVIGAGPAGAMAARASAQRGLKTLVVDRRSFPRSKVCGACVNGRAVSVLEGVGLRQILNDCRGVPLERFQLRAGRRSLSLPLPGGVAVSRTVLDAALIRAAVDSGAVFIPSVAATVLPQSAGDEYGGRTLLLKRTDPSSDNISVRQIRTAAVVAADGLGHPALQRLPEFAECVASTSRIGIGGVLDHAVASVTPGTIHMAVGQHGYVGLVRIEDGRTNIAAAIDPASLQSGVPADAIVHQILTASGFGDLGESSCDWTGTPRLTRHSRRVAARRVFLVGDAAGYVEPFTGEGIAWALAGGIRVAGCVEQAVRCVPGAAERHWEQEWAHFVRRRQKWCRRLTWLLRRPEAVKNTLAVASFFPRISRHIVGYLNTPVIGLKSETL